MSDFNNVQPEEFLLFIKYFRRTPKATRPIYLSRNKKITCTHRATMKITWMILLQIYILGHMDWVVIFPENALYKKNHEMIQLMHKLRNKKIRTIFTTNGAKCFTWPYSQCKIGTLICRKSI